MLNGWAGTDGRILEDSEGATSNSWRAVTLLDNSVTRLDSRHSIRRRHQAFGVPLSPSRVRDSNVGTSHILIR